MRVLLVHNRYRSSAPSGEDEAVGNEQRMLEARGVEVVRFDRCNDDIDDSSLGARASIAVNTVWSRRSREEIRQTLRDVKPDVVHVHNTFAMLSPSIYGAFRAEGLPVVQTLHNFRFFCPGALFLRDGRPCEDCVDHSLLRSIRHRCYRNSLGATTTLAAMLALHRAMGTFSDGIDRYISLTGFAKTKAVKGGLAEHKIAVKPNFIPNPPSMGGGGGGYAVFVGRLLEGKGTETLLAAWRRLAHVKLKIVGDGALRPELEARARRDGLNVEFLGRQPRQAVLQAMSDAEMLVVPSEWYEGFPMVVAESFACGTPVLASRIGSLDELVQEGITGRKFAAADPGALADGVIQMLSEPGGLRRMRTNARAYFDAHLTEEMNYSQLSQVYAAAIADAGRTVH
jgi:glycosyltransferase involved in cell wall biosynthesis